MSRVVALVIAARSSAMVGSRSWASISALRLCWDRIVPARKDRPVTFALPNLKHASDAVMASAAIVEAVANGDLTPSEAAELSKVIDGFARALEAADFEERLSRLEQRASK